MGEHFCYLIFSASESIFSINMPYPRVGSFTKTCVTAPMSLPFWIIGEPLTSDVNKGQQIVVSQKNKHNHLQYARHS